jgi:hypothetical protein
VVPCFGRISALGGYTGTDVMDMETLYLAKEATASGAVTAKITWGFTFLDSLLLGFSFVSVFLSVGHEMKLKTRTRPTRLRLIRPSCGTGTLAGVHRRSSQRPDAALIKTHGIVSSVECG